MEQRARMEGASEGSDHGFRGFQGLVAFCHGFRSGFRRFTQLNAPKGSSMDGSGCGWVGGTNQSVAFIVDTGRVVGR